MLHELLVGLEARETRRNLSTQVNSRQSVQGNNIETPKKDTVGTNRHKRPASAVEAGSVFLLSPLSRSQEVRPAVSVLDDFLLDVDPNRRRNVLMLWCDR